MRGLAAAAAVVLGTLVSGTGHAAETPVAPAVGNNVRRTVWSFGLTGMRHDLKSASGGEFLGTSAGVNIGSGYLADKWFAEGTVDILLGPYEPTLDRELDTDYTGYGGTVWLGLSAQATNLRSSAGGYGFALGFSYSDVTGRSSGMNRRAGPGQPPPAGTTLVDEYTNHVTEIAVLPAVFFSWFSPPRPKGNTPELLATRVEGYLLLIGAAMPLQASYSAKLTLRDASGATSATPVGEQGSLWGYSVLVSLQAMLGT